jgi:hypothetical protein
MARSKQVAAKSSAAPKKVPRSEFVKKKAAAQGGVKASIAKAKAKPAKKKGAEDEEADELGADLNATAAATPAGSDQGGAPAAEEADERSKKLGVLTKRSRARAYRSIAKRVGYLQRTPSAAESQGLDSEKTLVSVADAARLMRFDPAHAGVEEVWADRELEERAAALKEGAPVGAAKAVALYADRILRLVANKAVRHAVDTKKKKVGAAVVHAVLREYLPKLVMDSSVVNKGLLREAQRRGLTAVAEADEAGLAAEKERTKKAASNASKRAAVRAQGRKKGAKAVD